MMLMMMMMEKSKMGESPSIVIYAFTYLKSLTLATLILFMYGTHTSLLICKFFLVLKPLIFVSYYYFAIPFSVILNIRIFNYTKGM